MQNLAAVDCCQLHAGLRIQCTVWQQPHGNDSTCSMTGVITLEEATCSINGTTLLAEQGSTVASHLAGHPGAGWEVGQTRRHGGVASRGVDATHQAIREEDSGAVCAAQGHHVDLLQDSRHP